MVGCVKLHKHNKEDRAKAKFKTRVPWEEALANA
jgi:hypothetical protein